MLTVPKIEDFKNVNDWLKAVCLYWELYEKRGTN